MSAPLPVFPASELPPLAYAHDNAADIAATPWRPITEHGWVKPHGGTGLWTAPITQWCQDGSPGDTSWLEWCRAEMSTDGYTHLTEITARESARVLRIDSQADLIAIVDGFPSMSGHFSTSLDHRYPHWVRLAEAGWDAVSLTDRGQWETRLPPHGPNLYGWDCASVLWLRPAFTVGRTTTVPAAAHGGAS